MNPTQRTECIDAASNASTQYGDTVDGLIQQMDGQPITLTHQLADNHHERVHAVRLTRWKITLCPGKPPLGLNWHGFSANSDA